MDKQIQNVQDHVMEQLVDYDWPGNIRQLQHVLERAVLMSVDGQIDTIQLPAQVDIKTEDHFQMDTANNNAFEKAQLLAALNYCNFKVSGLNGAAAKLNLSPAIVYGLIKKYGISKSFESPS